MNEYDNVRVEESQKRVRAMFGGEVIVDSTHPLLVWEKPYYPTYYFAGDDVRRDLLAPTGTTERSPSRGEAERFSVQVGGRVARGAVRYLPASPVERLVGTFSFDWEAMDHWFEEDEEVFVHARDPYTRVDCLPSSRHVRVEIGGTVVADSTRPVILFETGLPARYYLPKTDVRMDLLTPSDTETRCPYKGRARYWSVTVNGEVHSDVVWGYNLPAAESAPIAGLVAFFNEKVGIVVDGNVEARPQTHFS